jgi:hypothetical protein
MYVYAGFKLVYLSSSITLACLKKIAFSEFLMDNRVSIKKSKINFLVSWKGNIFYPLYVSISQKPRTKLRHLLLANTEQTHLNLLYRSVALACDAGLCAPREAQMIRALFLDEVIFIAFNLFCQKAGQIVACEFRLPEYCRRWNAWGLLFGEITSEESIRSSITPPSSGSRTKRIKKTA